MSFGLRRNAGRWCGPCPAQHRSESVAAALIGRAKQLKSLLFFASKFGVRQELCEQHPGMANEDPEVLKSMILAFRLTELQTLLVFAGKSKNGKKSELQRRALAVVRPNTPEIRLKVRELSNAMYTSLGSASSVNPYSSNFDPPGGDRNFRGGATPRETPQEEQQQQQPRREMRQSTRENSRASTAAAIAASTQAARERASNSVGSGSGGETGTKNTNSKERTEVRAGALPHNSAASPPPAASTASSQAILPRHYAPIGYGNDARSHTSSTTLGSFFGSNVALGSQNMPPAANRSGANMSSTMSMGHSYTYDDRRNNLLFPTYPDVKLRSLPYFKPLATLMPPCSLQPSGNSRFQEQKFSFHLSPSQASEIAGSVYRDGGIPQYKKQLLLRFSLLEVTAEQDDTFPCSISVKVNNKIQTLPNPIPTNKPGMEPKRPSKPINITANSKLSSTQPNIIDISWAVDFGRGYTVSVYYVDKLSADDLMSELKKRGTRLPDYTRALIKEKLNDKDADIATTSCKVTLACPLGKMRMTYPCRANTCDHLQCFDGKLYLMLNERKPKWLCPVCNKTARFEHLLLDGFFKEVLASPRLTADGHEIVLHNDGTWDPLSTKKAALPEAQKAPVAPNAAKIETLDVDDDDDEEASTSQAVTPPVAPIASNAPSSAMKTIDCITLDDSDSSDDDFQPGNKRMRLNSRLLEDSSSPSPPPQQEPVVICLDDD